LRMEDSSDLAEDDYMTPRQISLWEYLRELPAGDNLIEAPASLRSPGTAAAAIMRAESERVKVMEEHGERGNELNALRSKAAELEWQLSQLEEIRDWKEFLLGCERDAREDAETRAENDGEALELARRELEEDRGKLDELLGSTSWRLTAPLRAAR